MKKYPYRFYVYPNTDDHHYAFRVTLYKGHRSVVNSYASKYRRGKPFKDDRAKPAAFFRPFQGVWLKTKGDEAIFDSGFLGELYYSRDMLDMGTIAHECLHAAMRYCEERKCIKFRGKGKTPANNEEILAWAMDSMTNQIVNKLIEYKL